MREFSTVKRGSKGTDVVVLQCMLRALQYTGRSGKPIDIDGYCGLDTVHAINEFQTKQRAFGFECGTNGVNDSSFGAKCWQRLLGV